jgi:hypothetical protein
MCAGGGAGRRRRLACRLFGCFNNNPKARFFESVTEVIVPLNDPVDTIVIVDGYFHAPVEGNGHYSKFAAEAVSFGIVKICTPVLFYEQIACLGLASRLI